MTSSIVIDTRRVGGGEKAFVIAEVGQNHDGSLGTAYAYVDAAADAGADAVKFQTHIALHESTLDEPFRVKFSRQDATRYAYWKRMEFTPEQWRDLVAHARSRGLIFLSSPFSVAAVELLRDLGMPAWKVGSGEVFDRTILEAMAGNGAPVLLSTGMSSWEHMTWAVDQVRGLGLDVALFQCTSRYPSALEEVGLNVLPEIRARFGCPAGLSDHSGSVFPGLAALAQGADLLEVHLTLTRRAFGPDIPVSLTVEELALLCHARDSFHTMRTHPVDKDAAAEAMSAMRGIFSKSLAPSRPLAAGTVLTPDMLCPKKPGTGIPVSALQDVVGKTLQRDVTPERLLRPEDFA